MSQEIALHAPASSSLSFLPETAMLSSIFRLSAEIANTEFVPKALRGRTAAVAACMLYGRELGIGALQALQQIQVIEGKPSASPELMRALVRDRGHSIIVKAKTESSVTLVGKRADDGSTDEVTWSLQDAERAGLCRVVNGKAIAKSKSGNPLPWESYTRAMLLARATSELCRSLFPDVISGVSYTPEEAASINPVNLPVLDVNPEEENFDAPVPVEPTAVQEPSVIELEIKKLVEENYISGKEVVAIIRAFSQNGAKFSDLTPEQLEDVKSAVWEAIEKKDAVADKAPEKAPETVPSEVVQTEVKPADSDGDPF